MSMSQRSIAAYATRRPYDSTPFLSHARSGLDLYLWFAYRPFTLKRLLPDSTPRVTGMPARQGSIGYSVSGLNRAPIALAEPVPVGERRLGPEVPGAER